MNRICVNSIFQMTICVKMLKEDVMKRFFEDTVYDISGLVCWEEPLRLSIRQRDSVVDLSGAVWSGCLTEHMCYQHWLSKCFANTQMFMVTLMMATLGYCANSENYDRTRSFDFLLGGLEHTFFSITILINKYIYTWDNPSHWLIFFRGVAQPPSSFATRYPAIWHGVVLRTAPVVDV